MFKNDKAQMNGYSDDIDTLLVFVSRRIFGYLDSRLCDVDELLYGV